MQWYSTSAFLEVVRIVTNIMLGICIPVVAQLWIKVTCIAAAQIVLVSLRLRCHFYAMNSSFSVPFLVCVICIVTSIMTTMYSHCHNMSNSNG